MIDLQDYPKFFSDIQTKNLNVNSLLIIGWDRGLVYDEEESPQYHVLGGFKDNSLFLSERKDTLGGIYYQDVNLVIPSINESYDFARGKYKINNISLSLSKTIRMHVILSQPTPSKK